MSEIKLNSQEWVDFIFKKKNRAYGAYYLRTTSSKRHIYAIIIALIFVGIVTAIPFIVKAVSDYRESRRENMENIDIDREMTKLELEDRLPEEQIIQQEVAPPPPPLKSTIKFVPPVIAADDKVADDVEVLTQDELDQSKEQISVATVIGDDDENGIDIADLEKQQVVVEEAPKVFEYVEQMPSFPGGEKAMYEWIGKNLVYPVVAQENGKQGRVVVRFVVSASGKIENVEVVRGFYPACDEEAKKVVAKMPSWTPGKQNGKNVPVYFTIPIAFKLKQ